MLLWIVGLNHWYIRAQHCVLLAQIWHQQPPCHSLYITYYFMEVSFHSSDFLQNIITVYLLVSVQDDYFALIWTWTFRFYCYFIFNLCRIKTRHSIGILGICFVKGIKINPTGVYLPTYIIITLTFLFKLNYILQVFFLIILSIELQLDFQPNVIYLFS